MKCGAFALFCILVFVLSLNGSHAVGLSKRKTQITLQVEHGFLPTRKQCKSTIFEAVQVLLLAQDQRDMQTTLEAIQNATAQVSAICEVSMEQAKRNIMKVFGFIHIVISNLPFIDDCAQKTIFLIQDMLELEEVAGVNSTLSNMIETDANMVNALTKVASICQVQFDILAQVFAQFYTYLDEITSNLEKTLAGNSTDLGIEPMETSAASSGKNGTTLNSTVSQDLWQVNVTEMIDNVNIMQNNSNLYLGGDSQNVTSQLEANITQPSNASSCRETLKIIMQDTNLHSFDKIFTEMQNSTRESKLEEIMSICGATRAQALQQLSVFYRLFYPLIARSDKKNECIEALIEMAGDISNLPSTELNPRKDNNQKDSKTTTKVCGPNTGNALRKLKLVYFYTRYDLLPPF